MSKINESTTREVAQRTEEFEQEVERETLLEEAWAKAEMALAVARVRIEELEKQLKEAQAVIADAAQDTSDWHYDREY